MKQNKRSGLLKTTFLLLLCVCFCRLFAEESPWQNNHDALLAVVNGEPITLADILPYTSAKEFQARSVLSGAELQKRIIELRSQAVEKIIERRLLVEDYNAGNFKMAFSDVENEIDRTLDSLGCRSRAELEQKLRASGSNYEKFRKTIEEQMIQQLMYQRECQVNDTITPQDVRKYYDANLQEFSEKSTFELAMLQLNKKRSNFNEICMQLASDLKTADCNFEQLVSQYSDGPNKIGGGVLGKIAEDKLRPEFAAALAKEKITKGCIIGPIDTANALVYLKVINHSPGYVKKFETVSADIENNLKTQARQRCFREYVERLRKEASIQYFNDIKNKK